MKKLYHFNEDYFETIDTEDKAYFLGLLFADGNIYMARHRVQITLANEDAYILKAFANCIKYTGKLYIDRERYSKLILPSKKMCEDLIRLGCTPNKSLTLNFPTGIQKELIHHFIRGCFDGDGHVSKKNNCFNVNFTSSSNFMTEFIRLLNTLNIDHTGSRKRYKDKEKSACQVYIKSSSALKFFNYIYEDSNFYLSRKKEVINRPVIKKSSMKCTICESKYFAKGFCKKHYRSNYFQMNKK